MSSAFLQSRVLYSAAKLELADGPKAADELAEQNDSHASSLHRLMRTLANLGVLSYGKFPAIFSDATGRSTKE